MFSSFFFCSSTLPCKSLMLLTMVAVLSHLQACGATTGTVEEWHRWAWQAYICLVQVHLTEWTFGNRSE